MSLNNEYGYLDSRKKIRQARFLDGKEKKCYHVQVTFLLMTTLNIASEGIKENPVFPETIEKTIIRSFRALFEDPGFIKKIREEISTIPEHIQRMQLMGVLNRITWLGSDASRITEQTKHKLWHLLASIDPKITNTTV